MVRRLRCWWTLGALAIALAVAAAACGDGDEEIPPAQASPTEGDRPSAVASPTTPAAGELVTPADVLRKDPNVTKTAEIEWGWMFELTGPPQIQVFGEVTGDGVKFAVDEINEAGGFQVGDTIYTIELLEHDTRSDVANTVAIATQLVRDDKVNVIWGPAALGEPEATQITQPNQVLHFCACQDRESTSLTSVEQAQGDSRWAFQTLPAVSGFFLQGALNTKEEFPEFTTVAMLCINTEIGQSVCGFYEEAYAAAGFELVGRENFPPGTTDYSPFLTRVRAEEPDILLNFDDAAAQINLLRQALELDVGKALNTSLTPDLLEPLLGPGVLDKIFLSGGIPRQAAQPTSQAAADYFERYADWKGGDLPPASFVSLLSYDFVYMLVAAMQQAGTVEDTTAISEVLETLHFSGAAEDDVFFDERHIAVMGSDDCTVIRGEADCIHNPPLRDEDGP